MSISVKVLLENPLTINNEPSIARFVTSISNFFPPQISHFEPYKPNKDNYLFWTLDQGNDYKVKFFRDKPCELELIHRYCNLEVLILFAFWLHKNNDVMELQIKRVDFDKNKLDENKLDENILIKFKNMFGFKALNIVFE
jgi:hypothetical protein